MMCSPLQQIRRFFHQKNADSFLISPQKHMLWYSLEVPRWGASNEYPQHMFSRRNKKNIIWISPLICSYVKSNIITYVRYACIPKMSQPIQDIPFFFFFSFFEEIWVDILRAGESSARQTIQTKYQALFSQPPGKGHSQVEIVACATKNTRSAQPMHTKSGPSCSKLTTSLVNDSLKFTSSDKQICWNFLLKKCE